MTDHFTTYAIPRDQKVRYGAAGDGGYVTVKMPITYDCYISAGVSNEESFTRDFLSKEAHYLTKDHCFGYDGTIEDYPWSYCQNITFRKQNIGDFVLTRQRLCPCEWTSLNPPDIGLRVLHRVCAPVLLTRQRRRCPFARTVRDSAGKELSP